jgi:UPF0716 family protein affecting phage T7 exclusion
MSATKIVARVSGFFLLISGLIGSAVALLSIVDPVASKMADDGDPFGTPPSRLTSLLILLIYLRVSCPGAFLVRRSGRKSVVSV